MFLGLSWAQMGFKNGEKHMGKVYAKPHVHRRLGVGAMKRFWSKIFKFWLNFLQPLIPYNYHFLASYGSETILDRFLVSCFVFSMRKT